MKPHGGYDWAIADSFPARTRRKPPAWPYDPWPVARASRATCSEARESAASRDTPRIRSMCQLPPRDGQAQRARPDFGFLQRGVGLRQDGAEQGAVGLALQALLLAGEQSAARERDR